MQEEVQQPNQISYNKKKWQGAALQMEKDEFHLTDLCGEKKSKLFSFFTPSFTGFIKLEYSVGKHPDLIAGVRSGPSQGGFYWSVFS